MGDRLGRSDRLTKAEWGVCVAATLAAIWLHVIYLTHAGGLWRDEAAVVQLAVLPGAGEVWEMLPHGGTPALFPAAVRLWSAIGFGASDFGLRCLGFGIGLAILGAIWLNARVLGISFPLVSLGLLAANSSLVRWGDSLRAYGLGCFFILLTLALVWSLMLRPGVGRFLAATLAAVFCVQSLYPNAFLVLAICVAGCGVCLRHDEGRTAMWVLAVGVAPALSLVPYIGPVSLSQRWWAVSQTGVHASVAWSNLFQALGGSLSWLAGVWFALGALAFLRGLVHLSRPTRRHHRIGPEQAPVFAAATIMLMILFFLIFVLAARLPTQPWQFLPLAVPVAVCIDAALAGWLARFRIWRLAFAALLICLPLRAADRAVRQRQTNIDLLAARVGAEAKPGDLVLVHPWYYGVTFNRYYRGAAAWTTLPPLSDFRLHRYDLLRQQLAATSPSKPVLDQITKTLTSGNRLWIVGELPPPQPGETEPPDIPPAPEGPQGWFDVPYSYVWGRQADYFLSALGRRVERVPTGSDATVSIYENASLTVVE